MLFIIIMNEWMVRVICVGLKLSRFFILLRLLDWLIFMMLLLVIGFMIRGVFLCRFLILFISIGVFNLIKSW